MAALAMVTSHWNEQFGANFIGATALARATYSRFLHSNTRPVDGIKGNYSDQRH